MATEIIMPKVDMDMATGKISKWHVREGDTIKKGALLFEIETDKAAMEIDAPADGVIRNISAAEGAIVPVGTAVAFIYAPGEAVTQVSKPVDQSQPATRPDAGKNSGSLAVPASGHFRATPLAKRLARQSGVSLKDVSGSGPRGRIVMADVKAAIATPQQALPQHDMVPIDSMRRTIAQRLTLSKQTIPHFYLTVTCDLTNLLNIRESLNAKAPLGSDKSVLWKLSINDFVIKALALSLKQTPEANATWTDDSMQRHHTSDVGVAVAVAGGLMTPVVRSAETKTLSQISTEVKNLAARARSRKLLPSEYQGGTTAISNLGMYGIEEFAAIINPPHATILAVGAAIENFVAVNGKPVLRSQMKCTLSCDHRVVDGAVGAKLLQAFRSFIEEPALMLA